MKTRKLSFKLIYLIYVILLAALVIAAVLHVRSLLQEYEASQPDLLAQDAVMQLTNTASSVGSFWSQHSLPQVEPGPFEQNKNIQKEYFALFSEEELTVSVQSGSHAEDELFYIVENGGFPVAEVKLKASGPAVTKLAVLTLRDWQVESVTPLFETHDYTLTVPSSFDVQINGITLTAADGAPKGERQIEYAVSGLYVKPDLHITDPDGNQAEYTLRDGRVMVEFYDYSLTLPAALMVDADGKACHGESVGKDRLRYEFTSAVKPTVRISDFFGNTVEYEGGSQIPLTYATINTDQTYTVQVAGRDVPAGAVTIAGNPEYVHFADYVQDLPQLCTYSIAILQNDAEITVTDAQGNPVALNGEDNIYDLTTQANRLDAVPAEVANQVDVLQTAQNWSLFMSNDLPFASIQSSLISTSYQYEVARKYATGIDITFTSAHTLPDPAFTDISVDNFVWITEDCFSVDIGFVKHMVLTRTGEQITDPMNDRFYFVRYDDTDNGLNDPTWKLASMKEIVK